MLCPTVGSPPLAPAASRPKQTAQHCNNCNGMTGRPTLHRSGPRCSYRSNLVLQRKRADCGIASPVIAGLCGQNANRQSKHERGGGDDYASGHHGSPLSFYVHLAIAVYSAAACDGRHRFGECGDRGTRVQRQFFVTARAPWRKVTFAFGQRLPRRTTGQRITPSVMTPDPPGSALCPAPARQWLAPWRVGRLRNPRLA